MIPPATRPRECCGWHAALIAFMVTMAVYSWTMAPTVTYGGDCGDLISSSYTLGISHPTGYPLYMVVGRLLASVPLGEVAARYNFLSALGGALTAGLVAAIVVALTTNAVAGIVAALSLSFCYLFWSQAGIAEVYTLSAAGVALLILLAVNAFESTDGRWTSAFFLAGGFTLTHHLSALFALVPLGLLVLVRRQAQLAPFALAGNVLLVVPPLLLYAYLPIRAAAAPGSFWGDLTDPLALLAHLSGRLYRTHMFALSASQSAARGVTLSLLVLVSLFAMSAFVVPGLLAAWRRRPALAAALAGSVLFNLIVDLPYDVGDWVNFFFPTYVVLVVLAGQGVAAVSEWVIARAARPQVAGAVLTAVLLTLPALQVVMAGERASFHGNRRALTQTRETLSQVAPGATVFVRSDELLFTAWYVQRVRKEFTDRHVESTARLGSGEEPREMIAALKESAAVRPTFVAFWLDEDLSPFHLRPAGRVCELARAAPQARPADFPSHLSLQVRLPAEAKRELVLPLTVRWRRAPTPPRLEFAFLHRTLRLKLPPVEMKEELPMSSPLTVNAQLVGWRMQRALHPDGEGAQEERLASTVPAAALPGAYEVFVRWAASPIAASGPAHGTWIRAGVMMVVDL